MFNLSPIKFLGLAVSLVLGSFAVYQAAEAAIQVAPSILPLQTLAKIDLENWQSLLMLSFISVLLIISIATVANLIIWPFYRMLFGSKAGQWVYVVQNVRPRIFDSGEGISFDSLHGLKEAKLCGALKIKDSLIDIKIPKADVHYYDEDRLIPGDFRGDWKSDDVSISPDHIRIKYSISVSRALDGEKEKIYTGYYLLEPSPDVVPIYGGEVWEGVVFTVNKFGGLFGLVYAERIPRKSRTLKSKSGISILDDHIASMFKRIRTPDKGGYVSESREGNVIAQVSQLDSDFPDLTT